VYATPAAGDRHMNMIAFIPTVVQAADVSQISASNSLAEEMLMRFVAMFTATAIAALVSASAMAQTAAAPAASTTPMATTKPMATAKSTTGAMAKPKAMAPAQSAVSKECSMQADAKGLHGKERSKFRSECKKNGGKA